MSNTTDNGIVFPARHAVRPDRPCPMLPSGWTSPVAAFVQQARKTPDRLLIRDTFDQSATYGDGLAEAMFIALSSDKQLAGNDFVGLLLPPSKAALLANVAVSLRGQIPINLNYSSGDGAINSGIKQTGLAKVLTTRKVMEKGGYKVDSEVLYIDEVLAALDESRKAEAWIHSKLTPRLALPAFFPGLRKGLSDTNSIMFTSGSSGEPKGVELTNSNILYNIAQLAEHTGSVHERVLGCLPYFHSYGYGVTLWAAACLGFEIYSYANPLDARGICEYIAEHGITAMTTTPTFMRNYLKRGSKEQFKTVKLLMMGAEKLKPELARDIREKLEIEGMEGYGCTETSPVLSSCIGKKVRSTPGLWVDGNREGSVGQPVPGTPVAIVNPETGEILPRGRKNEGRVFVGGPQIMKGYWNKPQETANVLRNGWYFTGDIGALDEDGFLYLTDRESRFAKVGPEMVPLIRVEQALRELAGVDELSIAVCAIPDPTKGEKVVCLYIGDKVNPAELTKKLTESGMHTLWIPKLNDFHKVEGPFPAAAIGKLDLKAIKKMALALDGQSA